MYSMALGRDSRSTMESCEYERISCRAGSCQWPTIKHAFNVLELIFALGLHSSVTYFRYERTVETPGDTGDVLLGVCFYKSKSSSSSPPPQDHLPCLRHLGVAAGRAAGWAAARWAAAARAWRATVATERATQCRENGASYRGHSR